MKNEKKENRNAVEVSERKETNMERQSALINLIWSIFGVVFCFVAAIVFMAVYSDITAGLWVIGAGLLSALCFHLHILKYFAKLETNYSASTLQLIDYGGLSACLLGFGFLCWNLSRLITWKQEEKGDEHELNFIIEYGVANFIVMMFGLYVKISVMIYLADIRRESIPIVIAD